MHIAALTVFAEHNDENYAPNNDMAKFISGINKVIKAAYLPEFIMKQYGMLMIVHDDMRFDFEGFAQWQKEYNASMNMQKYYYLIVYRHPKLPE